MHALLKLGKRFALDADPGARGLRTLGRHGIRTLTSATDIQPLLPGDEVFAGGGFLLVPDCCMYGVFAGVGLPFIGVVCMLDEVFVGGGVLCFNCYVLMMSHHLSLSALVPGSWANGVD